MPLRRRHFLYGLAGVSLPLIAASCAPTTTTPTDSAADSANAEGSSGVAAPATIRIGYQVIPNAELLAKALGLTEKAFPNSKVQYSSFDSGRDVNTAFAANGIDFGLAGSVPVAVGISQGLPYEVYFIHDVIGDAEALAVRDGIASTKDLAGKKVAVPFGSTTHFSLLALLGQDGVDSASLTLLDLQPQDLVAAWQRGDIDAAYVWEPHLTRLVSDGGQILTTSADLADRGVLTADVGLVHKDFAQNHTDALRQYIAVLDEAVEFYRANPDEAAEALAKELGLTPEESLASSKGIIWLTSAEQADAKFLGTPDQPGDFADVLKDSAEFLVKQKAIDRAADITTFQQHLRNDTLKS
ncbi:MULTISPECIES: ABC transporter substrate-binding protein [Cyanophyceae]|uniref:ABC transporter substrate-binding protein n=1 Tax=Leptolyngbya subtilissima DQ-A4 TaxID=2933933 RepID=A0ABV0KB69_9CYAN|nr:ABC transporter substrate-binding protein [Nodosilinea sp. FACHB-141]MBD2111799.1 ABC transporter substrate-binding protein [Nodosilinea sp. FACHB-141]